MLVTGLYDITIIAIAPAWTPLGLALQAAVTEELWMRALLFRLLWRAVGPVPAFGIAGSPRRTVGGTANASRPTSPPIHTAAPNR
jgi:hypothetical protein